MEQKTVYTIEEAARYLNTQAQYVRALLKKGAKGPFPGAKKVAIGDNLVRWEIPAAEVEARKATAGTTRRGRADGRSKYFVFANAKELVALQEVATKLGLTIAPAYDHEKQKAQYARQKAAKAAKKAAAANGKAAEVKKAVTSK